MTKPTISNAAALRELRGLWSGVDGFEQLTEGEESRAFRFRRDGQAFILRINRSIEGFLKDRFVQRMWGGAGLPVPEVMLVERFGEDLALCVSRQLPGATLQGLSSDAMAGAVVPATAVLDAIAGVDVGAVLGYGPFDANGLAPFASWTDFLASIGDNDWQAVGLGDVSPWLQTILAVEHSAVRQLVHGDFGSNNVLFAGGRITGVLDWSEAMVGDGLYDVANILFWRPWLDCMEQQARHIEVHRADLMADPIRLRGYQLRIGLDLAYQSARSGDRRMVQWATERCAAL